MKIIFPSATDEAIDLLKQFLQWNPEKRITFVEAKQHPFLSSTYEHHQKEDNKEPIPTKIEFDFDSKCDKSTLKFLFYKEMILWARQNDTPIN